MTLPWYPRDMGLYARDTKHLSLLEHGAYNLLLDYYYANGSLDLGDGSNASSIASLLPDFSRLFRICSAITKDEQKAVESVISMFFVKDGDSYRHNKADEVIEIQTKKHKKRVEAGKKGGQSNATSNATSNAPQTNIQTKTKIGIESPSSESRIKAPLTPQLSTGRDLKPSVSEGGKKFSIERKLSDAGRERAKLLCKSLNRDIYPLFEIYDKGINEGGREPPKAPDAAFYAWIGKYTKGESL